VLLLYHRVNSWPLGGGLKKPPTRCARPGALLRSFSDSRLLSERRTRRQEVLAAMARHDGGGKGYLTREEFTAASQDVFACVALCFWLLASLSFLPYPSRD